jgi:cation:H+ antiporter
VTGTLLPALTGHGPILPLAALVVAGGLVFVLASRLTAQADVIANTTSLGGVWAGSLVLAGATSLPEILTDVNAALMDAPDIGVGDLLGSTLANLLILAVLDLRVRGGRLLHSVGEQHARVAVLGAVLTAMAGVAIAGGGWGRLGHVGLDTVAIAAVYVGAMRLLYRSRRRSGAGSRAPALPSPARLTRPLGGIGLATAGLALVTPVLVRSADALANETGVSEAFVGTLLVGVATSFPELAATMAAVRLRAFDLAVGNIMGSNAFNMTILVMMDVVYVRGPLLSLVSRLHVVTVGLAVACIGLATVAMRSKVAGARSRRLESVLIVLVYVLGLWTLSRLTP